MDQIRPAAPAEHLVADPVGLHRLPDRPRRRGAGKSQELAAAGDAQDPGLLTDFGVLRLDTALDGRWLSVGLPPPIQSGVEPPHSKVEPPFQGFTLVSERLLRQFRNEASRPVASSR